MQYPEFFFETQTDLIRYIPNCAEIFEFEWVNLLHYFNALKTVKLVFSWNYLKLVYKEIDPHFPRWLTCPKCNIVILTKTSIKSGRQIFCAPLKFFSCWIFCFCPCFGTRMVRHKCPKCGYFFGWLDFEN